MRRIEEYERRPAKDLIDSAWMRLPESRRPACRIVCLSYVLYRAMNTMPSPYRCRSCGASTYQRLVHRGRDGVMRYSGIYKCSGCPREFSELASWRERRLRPRGAPTGTPSNDDQGGTASGA